MATMESEPDLPTEPTVGGVLQDMALIMQFVQSDEPPAEMKPATMTLPIVMKVAPTTQVREEREGADEMNEGTVVEEGKKENDDGKQEVKEEIEDVPEKIADDAGESDSESDSDCASSSETDSDSDDDDLPVVSLPRPKRVASDVEEDDEAGPSNPQVFATKNEILVPEVQLPDIDEVSPDEPIECIGEVMNVVDSVVVVKGRVNSAHQVIDSGSLLVFDDRKVLGLVFETFGAVTQPLYSIRFPSSSSIDKSRVQLSRPVFHLPRRSTYVFTRHLLLLKGSDASNLHDEEPSDSEVEFSDDEKEAEHKRSQKRARRERGRRDVEGSVPEEPSELDYGDLPPDGPLPIDPRAGRAPPVRYDDDDFAMEGSSSAPAVASAPPAERRQDAPHHGRGRGHGDRGRGRGRDHLQRGRGRGRSHDRGRGGHRGAHPYSSEGRHDQRPHGPSIYERDDASYPPQQHAHAHRQLSPTSEAIARVTGQLDNNPAQAEDYPRAQYEDHYHHPAAAEYDQPYDPRSPTLPQQVPAQQYPTPHINPRFAFGAQGYGQQGFFPQFMPNPAMGMYNMAGAYAGYYNDPGPSSASGSQGYQYPPYDESQAGDRRYDYGY